MLNFTYAPNDHPYTQWLLSFFASTDWNYLPYSDENLSNTHMLILMSPSEFNERFFATDYIWKQYLKEYHSHLTFFTLGIYPNEHPNYLHLFNLARDFESKITKALPLNTDWAPFIYGAMDARTLLSDFLDGHGLESFLKPLELLKKIVGDIVDERNEDTSYEEIYTELIVPADLPTYWNMLLNRWKKYHVFLKDLPFNAELAIIDAYILSINPYFDQHCKSEQLLYDLQCSDKLRTISSITKKIKAYAKH